jgi:hypothetical protein
MTISPTLADLMTDPGELDVSCLDCHHNTIMPVTTRSCRWRPCCAAMPLKRRFPKRGVDSAVRSVDQGMSTFGEFSKTGGNGAGLTGAAN